MSQTDQQTPGSAILGWWNSAIGTQTGAARRARAELRRASQPAEVLSLAETHELHRRLANTANARDMSVGNGPVRLALIAALVASIDEHIQRGLPAGFGQLVNDRRMLSQMRFQRILHASDDWGLAIQLRRALPIVGRRANIAALGSDLYFWGDRVRNRWCFDYFSSRPPQSLQSPTPESPVGQTEDA